MTEIAEPRPSSTVVLARDGVGEAPELFMVRRHARSSFGAAFAFPGGVVDSTDCDVCEHCAGKCAPDADSALRLEAGGLDYYVAAIRELFEETGVLLADCDTGENDLIEARQKLNDGTLSWTDFVTENNVSLLAGALHYFSHWITPDFLPKRYSTRFFVATLPVGQSASHDDKELTASVWISAEAALSGGQEGKMTLYYPTRKTLEALAEHRSVEALVAWARASEAAGVIPIQPTTLPADLR